MNKKELLNLCLLKVEENYASQNRDLWTHKDYVALSEKVTKESKIYISASSLKRLFGKVAYNYFPQIQTRNALCIFIGYASWEDFSKQYNQSVKGNKSRNRLIVIAVILLMIFGLALMLRLVYAEASITSVKSIGESPLNVSFNYKLPFWAKNKYSIYFDDLNKPDPQILNPNNQTINHTFINSDVYHVQLLKGNRVIQSIPIVSLNNAWETLICDWSLKEDYCKNIYVAENITHDGVIQVNPFIVNKYGFDTTNNYWVKHRYFTEIGVPDNAFVFESRFRNPSLRDFHDCPSVNLSIVGLYHTIKIHLSSAGCMAVDGMIFEFGNTKVNSLVQDMSAFEIDLEEWHDLRVVVRNQMLSVFIDESELYNAPLDEPLGQLYGTIMDAKGNGAFDYIRYSTLDGDVIFEEDFN